MSEENLKIARKTFGTLLTDGFYLFRKHYLKLIGPMALFTIIAIVLRDLLLVDLSWQSELLNAQVNQILEEYATTLDPNAISDDMINQLMNSLVITYLSLFLNNLIGAVFTVIGICSVSRFLYRDYVGKNPDFKEEFKEAFNSKMLLPILIIGVAIPIGYLLLWIPGIIIFGFFIFILITYNLKDVENAPSEAKGVAKGNFLRIIGIFMITWIIIAILNFISSFITSLFWPFSVETQLSWYAPSTRNYGMIILSDLLYYIVEILLSPLFICLLVPLFTSERAKKSMGATYGMGYPSKGYGQSRPTYGIPQQEPAIKPSPMQGTPTPDEKGMFCPFCGYNVKSPKKFCPQCGESLDFT